MPDELLVGALLHDLALGEDHDPVRGARGLEAVGDQDRRTPSGDGRHRGRHLGLGRQVEVGGGLVEEQDHGVDQLGPGQRDQLPLTRRQRRAALRHGVVVAVVERGDEVVGADGAGGCLDLGIGRLRAAVGDVAADRAGEQERLLRHVAEPAAEVVEAERAQVVTVDGHRARVRVVEAGKQLEHGRLPGAGLADEGHRLVGATRRSSPRIASGGRRRTTSSGSAESAGPRTSVVATSADG